mmetsp:Transcript_15886/g.31862  ORF Transcript_15886/g.31862 Transcript_15886/m.31862 type:complete len:110 (+) Transcript_15886:214-543(+)
MSQALFVLSAENLQWKAAARHVLVNCPRNAGRYPPETVILTKNDDLEHATSNRPMIRLKRTSERHLKLSMNTWRWSNRVPCGEMKVCQEKEVGMKSDKQRVLVIQNEPQ